MIDQETIKKLYELNLRTMAESFKEQSNSIEYKNLTFEERFAHYSGNDFLYSSIRWKLTEKRY